MPSLELAIVMREIVKCEESLDELRSRFRKLAGTQQISQQTRIIVDIAAIEAQRDALSKIRGRLELGGML